MIETKPAIRKAMLERRRALSPEQEAAWSDQAQRHLLGSAAYHQARCLALYAAFDREVRTDLVLRQALQDGKQALFPRMKGRGPELEFCAVADPAELKPSRFGFLEPAGVARAVAVETLDLMLIPGVGFDREGYRLGFGAGCYDRVLSRLRPEAWTCGLAYSFQVVERLPRAGHDLPVRLLVTEVGFIPIA